jgi:hypothetical protein
VKRPAIETFLSRLDDSLRWTGIPARVADDMAGRALDRKHRPLRWIPIWPIAFSCAVFVLSLAWPFAPNLLALLLSVGSIVVAMSPGIQMIGPLGKASLEDDEREAALRKDSFLFCFGMLACLNCLGQPLLVILAILQHWHTAQCLGVATSALMLNFTLFLCLPTLYASWKISQLPKD